MRLQELFQSAVTSLRQELRQAVLEQTRPNPAAQVRQQLHLSDEEDGGVPQVKKAARPLRQAGLAAKVVEVQLGEAKLKILNKLRPLRIQCTVPAVTALISYCKTHVSEGQGQFRKKTAQNSDEDRTWKMPQDECPNLLRQVTWQPSVQAWAVHYKAADGSTTQLKLRVRSPKCGLAQQGVDPKEMFKQLRRQTYVDAMTCWNSSDCSKKPRIVLPVGLAPSSSKAA